MVPLKHLRKFQRTFEVSLINCETKVILTWSVNCVIFSSTALNHASIFAVADTKLYVPLVNLSNQDNSGLGKTMKWNKYQWKVTIERQSNI